MNKIDKIDNLIEEAVDRKILARALSRHQQRKLPKISGRKIENNDPGQLAAQKAAKKEAIQKKRRMSRIADNENTPKIINPENKEYQENPKFDQARKEAGIKNPPPKSSSSQNWEEEINRAFEQSQKYTNKRRAREQAEAYERAYARTRERKAEQAAGAASAVTGAGILGLGGLASYAAIHNALGGDDIEVDIPEVEAPVAPEAEAPDSWADKFPGGEAGAAVGGLGAAGLAGALYNRSRQNKR